MSYIKARHYYLKNSFGYQLSVYNSKSDLFQSIDFSISDKQLNKIYQQTKKMMQEIVKSSKLMEDFWQNSTEEMKKALCLSYSDHKIKKQRKISNVELSNNWTLEGFFAEEHQKLKSKNFLNQIFHFRIKGKHHRGIRFGNIHLAEDIVNSKSIFSIHWDNYSPKIFNLSALFHFLRDDIFS